MRNKMCLTCSCNEPYNNHGNAQNITVDDIKEAVNTPQARDMTTEQAIDSINKTWKKVKESDKKYISTDEFKKILKKGRNQ